MSDKDPRSIVEFRLNNLNGTLDELMDQLIENDADVGSDYRSNRLGAVQSAEPEMRALLNFVPEAIRPHLHSLNPYSSRIISWISQTGAVDDLNKLDLKDIVMTSYEKLKDKFQDQTIALLRKIVEAIFGKQDEESPTNTNFNNILRIILKGVTQKDSRWRNLLETPGTNGTSKQEAPTSPFNGMTRTNLKYRESQHRMKNHLQQIISLIKLKRKHGYSDSEAILDQSMEILQNFMTLTKNLNPDSQSLQNILDLESYLERNTKSLSETFTPDSTLVNIDINIESIALATDKIVLIGLIVNELCMNSLQHAYGIENDPKISISLSSDKHYASLTVQDDGKGLPEDFSWEESYGLSLVKKITEGQLKGTFKKAKSEDGTGWIVRFPLTGHSPDPPKTNGSRTTLN